MNNETDNKSTTSQELMETYHQTEKNHARARRCITLLILGVIAVHICLLWTAYKDFSHNRVPEFTAALGEEVANLSPQIVSDVRDMVNRLYPHYTSVFQQMFERDWPKMKDTAFEEMEKLDAYAQEKWPEIEKGIVDVVLTSEETLMEELSAFVTPAEAEAIAVDYIVALEDIYKDILSSTLQEHVNVAKEIGRNVEDMMATEPDIEQPVNMQEALGILLELAGSELQKGS